MSAYLAAFLWVYALDAFHCLYFYRRDWFARLSVIEEGVQLDLIAGTVLAFIDSKLNTTDSLACEECSVKFTPNSYNFGQRDT